MGGLCRGLLIDEIHLGIDEPSGREAKRREGSVESKPDEGSVHLTPAYQWPQGASPVSNLVAMWRAFTA